MNINKFNAGDLIDYLSEDGWIGPLVKMRRPVGRTNAIRLSDGESFEIHGFEVREHVSEPPKKHISREAVDISESIRLLGDRMKHDLRVDIWENFGNSINRDVDTYRWLMKIAASHRATVSGGPYTSNAIFDSSYRDAALSLGNALAKYSGDNPDGRSRSTTFFRICKAAASIEILEKVEP